jgi:chromosome partition protein MukE
MSTEQFEYNTLESVITDKLFPKIDANLRRGYHFDSDDINEFGFIQDTHSILSAFYKRFNAELVYADEDYYYLIPKDDKFIRSKQVEKTTMVIGQILAMMKLDPENLKESGWIRTEQIAEKMVMLLSHERISKLFSRSISTDLEKNRLLEAIHTCLRQLKSLGMLQIDSKAIARVRPRGSIMRFTDPVRGLENPLESQKTLIQNGYIEKDI